MIDKFEKKIRILHLIPSLNSGGAGVVVETIVSGIDKNKYEVFLCTWENDTKEVHGVKRLRLKSKKIISLRTARELSKIIKDNRIHIVHTHLFDADLIGFLATRFCGGIVLISTIHSFSFFNTCLHIIRYRMLSIFFRKFIAVSHALKTCLIDKCRIKPENIIVIYNGIEIKKYEKNPDKNRIEKLKLKYNIGNNEKIIGIVSRLDHRKGHKYLISAFEKIIRHEKNFKLIITGNGELKDELVNMVKNLKLDNSVIFTGHSENVNEMLSLFDVFAFPSIDEGLGLVVIEAMASGVPVIASSIGGIPEIIENGKTGILIPPEDSDAMAKAVEFIINNKEERNKIVENARKALVRFDSSEMIRQIDEVYDRLIEKNEK